MPVNNEEVQDLNAFIKYHTEGKKKPSTLPKASCFRRGCCANAQLTLQNRQGYISRRAATRTTGTKHAENQVNTKPCDKLLHKTKELVKLRYCDLEIAITTKIYGRTRFTVYLTFTHFIGKQRKQ
ncbi:hypothetical protein M433DRAFT_428874 [Acidomyces richmondensis BFW]|nr:hypothetical protein M433DRAFT_428874 [Acidomyces richmondensis BFW]